MLIYFLSFVLNDEYLNLLILAAFSNSLFYSKTSSLVKRLYLRTFPDDKAEILFVPFLNCIDLCFVQCRYQLFWSSH